MGLFFFGGIRFSSEKDDILVASPFLSRDPSMEPSFLFHGLCCFSPMCAPGFPCDGTNFFPRTPFFSPSVLGYLQNLLSGQLPLLPNSSHSPLATPRRTPFSNETLLKQKAQPFFDDSFHCFSSCNGCARP